jgi:hypothetical protein
MDYKCSILMIKNYVLTTTGLADANCGSNNQRQCHYRGYNAHCHKAFNPKK